MREHFITLIGASDYSFLEDFNIIILQLHQLDSIARTSSQLACLPACHPVYQPANQLACLPSSQPASLSASQPPSQPPYLPASQPLSQPVYQPPGQSTCQPACLLIHIGLNIHCTLYWTFIELLDLYSIGYCISGTFIMTDRSV